MIRPFRRFHEEPKTYTRKFKLRAASMVLDNNCSVPDVCASMDVGPTTLRRWIDQVRKEHQGQAVHPGAEGAAGASSQDQTP
ncbi:transposase [Pseudomonas chlororaphis]|nr:transposase [Pseudomonas chlororaphis]